MVDLFILPYNDYFTHLYVCTFSLYSLTLMKEQGVDSHELCDTISESSQSMA